VLSAGARTEPGDQQGFDLLVRGVGMLAPELGAAYRLAELAQIEGRPKARGQDVRGVIGHGAIVGALVVAGELGGRYRGRSRTEERASDLLGGGVPGRLGSSDLTLFENAGGGHLDLMTAEAIMSQL
jgi:hypothetical protein